CIIVDSTRRGKSMPDALSKTIPIWCAVINEAARFTYELPTSFKNTFRIADHVISDSERDQIKSRIDGWVEDLLDSHLHVPRLEKPLKPIFVSRSFVDAEIQQIRDGSADFHPVILVSASPMVSTPDPRPKQYKPAKFVYVQGSGDDEEMWSCELTPKLLWQQDNLRKILQTRGNEQALQHCLETIVLQERLANMSVGVLDTMTADVQIGLFGLWFGRRGKNHTFSEDERGRYVLIIHSDGEAEEDGDNDKEKAEIGVLRLGLESGKRGLQDFRKCITKVIAAAQATLPRHILICSSEHDGIGYDLNGSLAVCILSTCFDEDKMQLVESELRQNLPDAYIPHDLIKDDIHKRLQWITTFVPQAKPPSRKHMLRINEVLL
ncbi:uncharacterized protein FA14DRAFT_110992, partial [Meira miltonrushii]